MPSSTTRSVKRSVGSKAIVIDFGSLLDLVNGSPLLTHLWSALPFAGVNSFGTNTHREPATGARVFVTRAFCVVAQSYDRTSMELGTEAALATLALVIPRHTQEYDNQCLRINRQFF